MNDIFETRCKTTVFTENPELVRRWPDFGPELADTLTDIDAAIHECAEEFQCVRDNRRKTGLEAMAGAETDLILSVFAGNQSHYFPSMRLLVASPEPGDTAARLFLNVTPASMASARRQVSEGRATDLCAALVASGTDMLTVSPDAPIDGELRVTRAQAVGAFVAYRALEGVHNESLHRKAEKYDAIHGELQDALTGLGAPLPAQTADTAMDIVFRDDWWLADASCEGHFKERALLVARLLAAGVSTGAVSDLSKLCGASLLRRLEHDLSQKTTKAIAAGEETR